MEIHPKIQAANDALEEFQRQRSLLHSLVKEVITDKDVPVDQRWELFLESEIGGEDSYYVDWKSLKAYKLNGMKTYHSDVLDRFVHDGDRYSRHETIEVNSIIESLEYRIESAEKTVEDRLEIDEDMFEEELFKGTIFEYINERGVSFGPAAIDELKEEAMSMMVHSYKFDW